MADKIDQHWFNIFYGRRCNLACEGCSSGSDHVRHRNTDPELNDILNTIPVLAEKFNILHQFTLLGGDPFLYWDERIVPITRKLRKHFPTTKISILTNAMLLLKNKERVFELMNEIDYMNLDVTDHFSGFIQDTPAVTWANNLQEFFADDRIFKISNEHYHIKGNINLNMTIHRQDKWSVMYRLLDNGQIKPHATKNPELSMRNGCGAGSVCSVMLGSVLYKCNALASLPSLLKEKNQLDDPDWAMYLNSPTVNMLDINADKLQYFVDTYSKPIPQCDLCPSNAEHILPWFQRTRARVLPNKKETF